ncbi:N-6 DNA methylase [Streptococcus sp. NLN64]|uniref:Eco57I restriction-modification methylase domain-containing protein n=1 Tax=Streptococcus sp. NLN64 TaxID=2822799 RepID=UPI0018CA6B09|nr:N-6 DNA methylase [Streptococcus sp. NLN64]MBG9367418.1 N-6 DNA methylase [Streptococcus sp. NLN64]
MIVATPESIFKQFSSRVLSNEDDVKIYTYSDIILPIQQIYAPNTSFHSEYNFAKGGRADGTIANLVIEYKKKGHFSRDIGVNEALYGRKTKTNDSGLYQYIINKINGDEIDDSILDTFGIGFDGNSWIIARFAKSSKVSPLDITRTRFEEIYNSKRMDSFYQFKYKKFPFKEGVEEIITLFKSTAKIKLTKETLSQVINPKSKMISDGIVQLYDIIKSEIETESNTNQPRRTTTLYKEWDRTFGSMFGNESQETEFNATSSAIKELYGVGSDKNIDSKIFLFATQTYFNITLKILIDSFIKNIIDPATILDFKLSWSEIIELFEGRETENSLIISNFFEIHYYEWFTYLASESHQSIVTNIIKNVFNLIQKFDLATYKLRPEEVQDVLQEIYMTLIPEQIRHLLGEYFSPDWIVEHSLDRVGYFGDIDKKIIDPTCGSGAFVIQALKRVLNTRNNSITYEEAEKVTKNIVGFDLNPISAVSAKANYILTLLSLFEMPLHQITKPLSIPVYIADSVLSPIVYSEESEETFVARTSVGEFVIPKFETFSQASKFLDELSVSIDNTRGFYSFEKLVLKNLSLSQKQIESIKKMYEMMTCLHRTAQDSFWGRILKNSFAPVMLKQKFDFVVGNPPWIAWKSMSKVYREGTLDVWKSYDIFEKNAYDKKTTHDDFGMAVTYVALDQYLKTDGKLYFLLPWTFIKSTKGGEGFRKFEITRNGQKIPIKVELVDDYNDIKIFKPKHTVRTIGMLLKKGAQTSYPMYNWYEWSYKEKRNFQAHYTWQQVQDYIVSKRLSARPIDSSNRQSSWLTLTNDELSLSNNILLNGKEPSYRGRKGIEPAGAKGVYILKKPKLDIDNNLRIINDMSRQRREDLKSKGEQEGIIENTFIYPMIGGRNIQRWKVVSNEFMIVPHKPDTPYGLPEDILADEAPLTYQWLEYYKTGLLASRIQSGKFFNPETQPWYRLDNVGDYTFSSYKVIWKEQSRSFSAVALGSYSTLPNAELNIFQDQDKPVVVDSKVLMLATSSMQEAYYVSGILNSLSIRNIIDAYAVGLNRGLDVLKNIDVQKFDVTNSIHLQIASCSENIHALAKNGANYDLQERELDKLVQEIYGK